MHVVYITRYVIRIKKHLHNRIEIIEIESNCKEYESLHPYLKLVKAIQKGEKLRGLNAGPRAPKAMH